MEEKEGLLQVADVKRIIAFLTKMAPFVLIFIGAGVLVSYVYIQFIPPKYEITASIAYSFGEDETQNSFSFGKFDYSSYYINITNQIQKIKSYDLIKQVLQKVNYTTEYYIKGRIKTTPVFKGLPFSLEITVSNPVFYNKPIYIKVLNDSEIQITVNMNEDNEVPLIVKFDSIYYFSGLQIKATNNFVSSQNASFLSDINYFVIIRPQDEVINKVLSNLFVSNIEYSSIIVLKYLDEIPERGIIFIDTLCNLYINSTLERASLKMEKNLKYLDKVLNTIEERMEELRREKELIQQREKIIAFSREYSTYVERYFKLVDQKNKIENELKFMQEYVDFVRRFYVSEGVQILPLPEWISLDNFLKEGLNNLYAIRQAIINAQSDVKSFSFPGINALKAKMDSIKRDLIDYSKALALKYEERINDINKELRSYENIILSEMPSKGVTLSYYDRKLDILNKLLGSLEEKKIMMQLELETFVPSTKIMEKARISKISRDDEKNIYSYGIVGGSVFGFLFFSVIFLFFRKVSSPEEVRELTGLPLIGNIPFYKNFDIHNLPHDINYYIKEIFVNINSLRNFHSSPMAIVLTSMAPGAGKSTLSYLLSETASKMGQKTLLIDMDVYRPSIHKSFNIPLSRGLLEIISTNSTLNEDTILNSIYKSNENFHILTAGVSSIDPLFLLVKPVLVDLLKWAKKNYEVIIIDTIPFTIPYNFYLLKDYIDFFIVLVPYKKSHILSFLNHAKTLKEKLIKERSIFLINKAKTSIISKFYSKKLKKYKGGYYYYSKY